MNKTETFRAGMRILGYTGTDDEFDEVACLIRMTIRLGCADWNDLPTLLAHSIWGSMLQPMEL